jgi:hypothetical protein
MPRRASSNKRKRYEDSDDFSDDEFDEYIPRPSKRRAAASKAAGKLKIKKIGFGSANRDSFYQVWPE